MSEPVSFVEKNKDFVLKLRLVGIGGAPQIRRVRLPRVVVGGNVSYDALASVAIAYTFPDAPLVPEDYDVTLTYYDVDNDCVTIASTEELVDAIGQFSDVLRITTDVKRKKNTRPATTTTRGAGPSRVAEAPGTTPSPSNGGGAANRTTQLHSILESFVSILATAVVALQSHMTNPANPTPPAAARVTTDAPTNKTEETKKDEAKETEAAKERTAATPAAARPFIHGRHTCDRCLCTPVVGKRFHATNLPDFDLCEKCMDNYKGTEIQFEEIELDRDRPFQERWHRKRARSARMGQCKKGPGAAQRFPRGPHQRGPGPRGRRCGGPGPRNGGRRNNNGEPMDAALKEAIRRSLQDVRKTTPEPTAPVEEKAAPVAEPEIKVETTTKDSSFSSDAIGNGLVAEVLGQTLDQCADAIDAMVKEMNRTASTSSSTAAEEKKEEDAKPAAVEETTDEPTEEEPDIVVEVVVEEESEDEEESEESVEEEHNDDEGEEEFVVEAEDTAGATIVESVGADDASEDEEEEKSVDSKRSEEWEVVSDGERADVTDEMLAQAAQVIGSALFESDMNNSSLTEGADSSVLSSVPTITSTISQVQLDRWAPQLTQLHELGFLDDAQSVEVLERLNAANIGVDSYDEITVERVVNELLKKKD